MMPESIKSFVLKCAEAGWLVEAQIREREGAGNSLAKIRFNGQATDALIAIGAVLRSLEAETKLSSAEAEVLLFYARQLADTRFPPSEEPPANRLP